MKYRLVVLSIIFMLIFKHWLGISPLASGDWYYHFPASFHEYIPGIWAWDFSFNNGLGGNDIFLLGLNSYFLNGSHFLLNILGAPWWLVERVMWYWSFLLVSSFSSYFLFKTFFGKNSFWVLAVMVFLINTYSLMLTGGGQVGVAIAFSLAPLVLGLYGRIVQAFQSKKPVSSLVSLIIIAGLVLGTQIFFDIRIVYVTLVAVLLLLMGNLYTIFSVKNVFLILVTFLIGVLINFFWIFPQELVHKNPLQELGLVYSTSDAVKFFSFAKFEDVFGLLHPNWPENIFGKVGFMKPEFLLLPLLAYGSLLFIKPFSFPSVSSGLLKEKQENVYILYFALLGLVGIFLAKGANDPFGGIYIWMFDHVPGFIMFRDPTKWYLLIVLSYSMLIPYSIGKVYGLLKRRFE